MSQYLSPASQCSGQMVASDTERHGEFYFKDGSVILMLPGTTHGILYRLHATLLMQRSAFFRGLFSLRGRTPDIHNHVVDTTAIRIGEEGMTDSHPAILRLPHGATQADFDNLLHYLFCGHSDLLRTERYLISILMLSTFFEIEDGRHCAITRFEELPSFHPALRLQLARLYRVDHWIEPAFRELLTYSLESLDVNDIDRIGIVAYHILNKTKEEIRKFRLGLAYTAPLPVNDLNCDTPLRCCDSWVTDWWNGVARHLLHPEVILTGEQILAILHEDRILGMCKPCQTLTVASVERSSVLLKENAIVRRQLEVLMGWQTDEAIRAAIHENLPVS